MEKQHQQGEIISDRYSILHILGQGGIGITYAAEDLQTGEKVALKAVSLRRTDDLKVLELFEREAKVLAQLKHPAVPSYIDYFEVGKRRDRFFYLAQQLADGQSLAELIENGWRPSITEVRWIANQILDILIYLQQLTPPVIHRDIKPQNIIRRNDGQIFLVDFGAVQDVYHQTITGGSTVVGTYGYMAPEQFRGKAVLATDLYGLGATLIYLLTSKAPADLSQRKLKIDFRSHVRINKQLADWLDRMIEPVAEDRFSTAKEALAVLRGEQPLTRPAGLKPHQVTDSPVTIKNQDNQLIIDIPPIWFSSIYSQSFALIPVAWNVLSFPAIWLTTTYGFLLVFGPPGSPGYSRYNNNLLFEVVSSLLFGSPRSGIIWIFILVGSFWLMGLWVLGIYLLGISSRIKIAIDRENIRLQRSLLGWHYKNAIGKTQDITQVGQQGISLSMNKSPIAVCTLQLKSRKHKFGTFLTEPEKAWLVAEINEFLGKH
jgi:eukaryotic-like serine/threonine-protein kinase